MDLRVFFEVVRGNYIPSRDPSSNFAHRAGYERATRWARYYTGVSDHPLMRPALSYWRRTEYRKAFVVRLYASHRRRAGAKRTRPGIACRSTMFSRSGCPLACQTPYASPLSLAFLVNLDVILTSHQQDAAVRLIPVQYLHHWSALISDNGTGTNMVSTIAYSYLRLKTQDSEDHQLSNVSYECA